MSPFFNNRGQNIVTAYDRKIKRKQIKPGIKTNQPRLNETRNVYLYSSNAVDRTLFFSIDDVLVHGVFVLVKGVFVLVQAVFVLVEGVFVLVHGLFVLVEGVFV